MLDEIEGGLKIATTWEIPGEGYVWGYTRVSPDPDQSTVWGNFPHDRDWVRLPSTSRHSQCGGSWGSGWDWLQTPPGPRIGEQNCTWQLTWRLFQMTRGSRAFWPNSEGKIYIYENATKDQLASETGVDIVRAHIRWQSRDSPWCTSRSGTLYWVHQPVTQLCWWS